MAIEISKALIKKLPESERENAKERLWSKSGGNCFLCGEKLIESSQKIVADHDLPEAEEGQTTLSNLNLTHNSCNSFKRNHSSVEVRPFLRLSALIKARGGLVKYGEAIDLLGIQAQNVDLSITETSATITESNGITSTYPVFSEATKEGVFKYCFGNLSKESIQNDSECQPRTIKLTHLWQIYADINRNPLHEQPGCRIEKVEGSQNSYRLLMFDGQHKSLAFWIAGRDTITVKIYLDITKDAAVRLVNSIQAKIKKLPLSPFELAAKMAEEWQERVDAYEQEVGTDKASEDGFIKWVEKDERTRAKSAFTDALYQSVIDDENLEFIYLVQKTGQKASATYSITESAFKNKVLKPLLHTAPLKETFSQGQASRLRESAAIIRILNYVFESVFKGDLSPQQELRAKRFLYQSALNYVFSLIRKLVGHRLVTESPRELLDKTISDDQWTTLSQDIDRLLDHPAWSVDFESSEKTKAFRETLSKNQDSARAFGDLSLKLGYVVGADELPPNWPE